MIPPYAQVGNGGTDPSLRDSVGPGDLGRSGGSDIPIESRGSQTPSQEGSR
jgi:hypothetical protein